MRVLIISYFFPPGDSIADLRAGKFAKHLLRLGVDVRVLTVQPDPRRPLLTPLDVPLAIVTRTRIMRLSRSAGAKQDYGQQGNTPFVTRMGRSFKRRLRFNNVRMPDDLVGWYPFAVKAGLSLGRQERFDCIFSSSGPVTSHLIASRLQRTWGCPWVADYRDMWSLHHLLRLPRFFQFLDQSFEKRTLANAAIITTVSAPLATALCQLHKKRACVLTNGYDQEDYPNAASRCELNNAQFVIAYTGGLYSHQDPEIFFQAVKRFTDKASIQPDRFKIRFVGRDNHLAMDKAKSCGVIRFLELAPPVTYYESLSIQKTSTVLLVIEKLSEAAKGTLTGKIFEYLGAGRPVLAIGHSSSVLKPLIEQTNSGVFCSNSQSIETQIDRWWEEYRLTGSVQYNGDPQVIRQYSRVQQAEKLYHLMQDLTGESQQDNAHT